MAARMNAPRTDWNEFELFKLRLSDVELLQRAGVLDGQRVELIEGVLIAVSPQLRPHSYVRNELARRFWRALDLLGSNLSAETEITMQITPETAPEPDLSLTSEPKGGGYVPIASVALAIEVSDTTLRYDLGKKRDIYARAGVPEYWVIDVNRAEVHRFANPDNGVYRAEPPIPLAGMLQSLTVPDLAIDGAGIL